MILRDALNDNPKAKSLDIDHTSGQYLLTNPSTAYGTQSGNVILCPPSPQLEINEPIVFDSFVGFGFLSSPQDARFDYVRRKIWIADAGLHKVIKIDQNSEEINLVLDSVGTFPYALASNLNNGGVFIKSYSRYSDIGAVYYYDIDGRLVGVFKFPASGQQQIAFVGSSSSSSSSDGEVIPVVVPQLPYPSSIVYDHVRGRVWWVDRSMVYMMDEYYLQVEAYDLSDNGFSGTHSIDVELSTGNPIIVAYTSPSTTFLVQMNRDNSKFLASAIVKEEDE